MASAAQPDLLSWPEIAVCRAHVIEAHHAQAVAQRRFRCAPHGEVENRLADLQRAVAKSLAAEKVLELAIEESLR